MLWRAELRNTAKDLLLAALHSAGATVETNKDTPTQGEKLPAIGIYVDDAKQGMATSGSAPQFRTVGTMTIEVRADGNSKDAAELLLDTLCELIENALLGSPVFTRLFEAIESVNTTSDYNGVDGKRHLFMAEIVVTGHTSERFEPVIPDRLDKLNIYLGTAFDPADPPFAQFSTSTE